MSSEGLADVWEDWQDAVNMSPRQDDDVEHMRRVVRYVHRHLAQRPSGDVEQTPWRYSLMNWGHDPLK